MTPRDLRYALTRPPVLIGAGIQAVLMTTYLTSVAYEPPGTVMLLGLAGGAAAGVVSTDPTGAWAAGAKAAGLGFVIWGLAHVGWGLISSLQHGTELFLIGNLTFVISLSLWAFPAYIVLGTVSAPVTAIPVSFVRRRLRLSGLH